MELDTNKQDYDPKTLEDVHKILEALFKSNDQLIEQIMRRAFKDES